MEKTAIFNTFYIHINMVAWCSAHDFMNRETKDVKNHFLRKYFIYYNKLDCLNYLLQTTAFLQIFIKKSCAHN